MQGIGGKLERVKYMAFIWVILCFILGTPIKVMAAEITEAITLTNENIVELNTYEKGWYKSWGGDFEESNSSFCTTKKFEISQEQYYIRINDSRIQIAISEYDESGNWIKHNDAYGNGDVFSKQEATRYINITISGTEWGMNILSLMEDGLEIYLRDSEDASDDEQAAISISQAKFYDSERWRVGAYSHKTGEFYITSDCICYEYYCVVPQRRYEVCLPGGYLKLNIVELDSEGNVVNSLFLYNGEKWEKKEETEKIAIYISTHENYQSFTTEQYYDAMEGYSRIGLRPSTKYNVDTRMADLSATEFMELMNVGWNLGNSFDSKATVESRGNDANPRQELNWGNPYVSKDLIQYVKDAGFNTIRIPVSWFYNSYDDENGVLHIGEGWLKRVKEVVDYALACDMYVIINSHHDHDLFFAGAEEEEFQAVLKDTTELWTEIAECFKDYDEQLIFEGFNEIDNIEKSWNYSEKAALQMNRLNQVFVDTVRGTGGNNSTRILMVPTLLDGIDTRILNDFVLPEDTADDRLIVQVHHYTKKFYHDIEAEFEPVASFAERIGAPVVIGEFGCSDTYPIPELRDEQAMNYVGRAAKYGIKCIWWDNGSNYGIVDRRDYSNSNTEMIEALIAGAEGNVYEASGVLTLNEAEQFILRMPDLSSGELEEQYWGTITSDNEGEMILVSSKATQCTISLSRGENTQDLWLQRVLFYDENKEYISGKELQKTDCIVEVPENSAYIRVSINSPTRTVTWAEYMAYLENRELELYICFV